MTNSQNIPVPDIKYKTELCRTWIEQNFCPYMEKCRFAHGKTDLHDKIIFGKNYKQKDCKSFHTKGYCPYGPRCLFRHDGRNFTELNRPFYRFILENNFPDLFFKNMKKRNFSEEEFLNNCDLGEIFKTNNLQNMGSIDPPNINSNNSLCYSATKNSELDDSQNLPATTSCSKLRFYTPHLKIFKKIRRLDSYSFDSTDVDMEQENMEYNLNSNGIGKNFNAGSVNYGNLSLSPKNGKNLLNFKSNNCAINSIFSNGQISGNLPLTQFQMSENQIANNFLSLEKSFEKNTPNLNKLNNNFAFNCQQNFPNFNNNFNNNNNLINPQSLNNKNNSQITNNNIKNYIITNNNQNFLNNSNNRNNFLKNLNLIQSQNHLNNNINQNQNLYANKKNIFINNGNFNSDKNVISDECSSSRENIDPNIMCSSNYKKNSNNSLKINLNNNIYKPNTNKNMKNSNKNIMYNNHCDDYNKIFCNPNTNFEFLADCSSPEKPENLSNNSILSTENSILKEENEIENVNNLTNENVNLKKNTPTYNDNYYNCINNNKEKINKEIIFENFSKITQNNNIKNNQAVLNKAINPHNESLVFENTKQSSYACYSIDDFMNGNFNINPNNSNKVVNSIDNNTNNKNYQSKESENYNFFNSNNSNNINFYSIY